ncbi:hypothetical protein C7408_12411 [Paraburkholderia caballeronis]|nr:hypothetical protein C7408_12411 [Paraburkholderia caballeronis]TDV09570.1 hypothetical protein C7406_12611 [Paraburkholderia caballeronis]TDV21635.1 hypothetical protein C7404_12111 [Paraburkholderia caballeronis]
MSADHIDDGIQPRSAHEEVVTLAACSLSGLGFFPLALFARQVFGFFALGRKPRFFAFLRFALCPSKFGLPALHFLALRSHATFFGFQRGTALSVLASLLFAAHGFLGFTALAFDTLPFGARRSVTAFLFCTFGSDTVLLGFERCAFACQTLAFFGNAARLGFLRERSGMHRMQLAKRLAAGGLGVSSHFREACDVDFKRPEILDFDLDTL